MSKTFDTMSIHKLILKLIQTNTTNIVIKFIANYIKGQQACTQYNCTLLKLKQLSTEVTLDEVLSPTLFNSNSYEILLPPKDIHITTHIPLT